MQETMVQLHPGLFTNWSVGVLAAHVRGKDEDRVQIPDGPLDENKWAVRPMVGLLVCNQEIGVRIPGGPLIRKVAGYGWPGCGANAVLPHRRSEFESLAFRLCLDGETEIIPRF